MPVGACFCELVIGVDADCGTPRPKLYDARAKSTNGSVEGHFIVLNDYYGGGEGEESENYVD
jgi:hypothetical protein